MAYSKAHVILIGFSIESPDSLDNVKHKVRFFVPSSIQFPLLGCNTYPDPLQTTSLS